MDRDARAELNILAKLTRSLDLLEQLETEIEAWSNADNIGIEVGEQLEPHVLTYVLVYHHPIPIGWSAIIGEMIHNLRSSLDNAVHLAALTNGGTGKASAFPVYWDEAKYIKSGRRRIRELPEHARSFIESVQPFASEAAIPHTLHAVEEFWIMDKHRVLQPWGVMFTNHRVRFVVEPIAVSVVEQIVRTGVIRPGAEAVRVTFSDVPHKVDMKGEAAFQICMDDPTDPTGKYDASWRSMYHGVTSVVHVLLSMIHGHPPYPPF
jgi:hypothetical protein